MLLSDTLKIYFPTFFIGKPLSIFNNDNAANGFDLCPNLYRAFDRGIIGVGKHYRVVIPYYHYER